MRIPINLDVWKSRRTLKLFIKIVSRGGVVKKAFLHEFNRRFSSKSHGLSVDKLFERFFGNVGGDDQFTLLQVIRNVNLSGLHHHISYLKGYKTLVLKPLKKFSAFKEKGVVICCQWISSGLILTLEIINILSEKILI